MAILEAGVENEKPHAVFFPFPVQGHIKPALQLAKLLHRVHGFQVTFVHTDHNRRRLLRSRGLGALAGVPGFRFVAVPDGLPPSELEDASQDMGALLSAMETMGPRFTKLLVSDDLPHVSCVISDVWQVLYAAKELGLPCVTLWTISGFMALLQCQTLVDMGIVPLKELLEETKERSYVTSWCPQEAVLRHAAIGAFLTHCGWNSVMESISAGVPMLCCPFNAEQYTNRRYVCSEWRIGMEISRNIERNEVMAAVVEMIEGDKGKEMKRIAMEWKEKATVAAVQGGSSWANLEKLVNKVIVG
ncbi:unnamed protein product [Alopecurus aequalis]